MTLQAKDDLSLGVYVHVPFCASTCDFCAFYQEKPKKEYIQEYLLGIEQELKYYPEELSPDTFFWGGGTPGLLVEKDLETLALSFLNKFKKKPKEWTVEMAPSTVKKDKIKLLKNLGVTRISMGVQSFNPALLEKLGRLHNLNQIHQAYDIIHNTGFDNLNLDLMFAIPGQGLHENKEDLQKAIALNPQHISTYCLTFEEDTALYLKLTKGLIKRDKELEAQLYEQTWDILESAGYHQYEISNFSKKGYECLHNINTWNMQEWIGFGPSAASQWKKQRFSNINSIEKWTKAVYQKPMPRSEIIAIDDQILAVDTLIFGLRMNKGIDMNVIKKRFQSANFNKLDMFWTDLIKEKLLIKNQTQLYLTPKGRLLADYIGSEILEKMSD